MGRAYLSAEPMRTPAAASTASEERTAFGMGGRPSPHCSHAISFEVCGKIFEPVGFALVTVGFALQLPAACSALREQAPAGVHESVRVWPLICPVGDSQSPTRSRRSHLAKFALEFYTLGNLKRRDDASPIGAGGFLSLLLCLNRRSSNLSAAVTAGSQICILGSRPGLRIHHEN